MGEKMNIGIDIDGVIANGYEYDMDYAGAYYVQRGYHIKNPFMDCSRKIYGMTVEQDDEFWNGIIKKYISNASPQKYAAEVINKLKKEGHRIIIMTNRVADFKYNSISSIQTIKMTKKWFKKHKISYDEIVFSSKHKIDDIKKHQIDIMIEDNAGHIMEQQKVCKVFCYNNMYNLNVAENENIIRVFCWYDIYDKLHQLNMNK